ncbi:DMT family transporter [Rhodococcus ruber]|nr:EamA/RhaT family transporter [Rhodococcus ruber]MBD8054662.1 DMT family transporter [Rhodococcus ruber]
MLTGRPLENSSMTSGPRLPPVLVARPRFTVTPVDPRVTVLAGAAATSLTAGLIKLSGVSPATSTLFRCAFALPVLGLLALHEIRRHGGISRRVLATQALGGAMLGIDFALWARSIEMIGAGIATVVVNVQVVVVPLLAWLVFRERVPVRFVLAVPFLFAGVALAGGALFGGGETDRSMWGTLLALAAGLAYGTYLFVAGRAGSERRASSQVFVSTLVAGVVGTSVGSLWGPVDLTPGWPALGWLAMLALSGQVLGWVLIGIGLPRLPSEVGATLLLAQPVLAMGVAIALVHERPTLVQSIGCAVVVAAVWFVSRAPATPERHDRQAPPPQIDPISLSTRPRAVCPPADLGARRGAQQSTSV